MYVQVRDNNGGIYGVLEIPDGKLSEFQTELQKRGLIGLRTDAAVLKCETVGDLPSWYGQDY